MTYVPSLVKASTTFGESTTVHCSQAPPEQVPLKQLWPQRPQFAVAVCRFTHVPPQSVVPAGHLHVPLAHVAPAPHALPQAPQFAASLPFVTLQVPLQSV
jgi:hypothetical protein